MFKTGRIGGESYLLSYYILQKLGLLDTEKVGQNQDAWDELKVRWVN